MKHFIATRFNLKHNAWKTSKHGDFVLTEEWLEHRFNLFEKYCFQSILNQVNKNFYWFIFFDVETPEVYKKRIKQLTSNYPNILPQYIDGIKSLNQSLKSLIHGYLDKDDNSIITTRLDNDDSIHKDFIDIIQKLSFNKTDAVIDLRKGYQLQVTNGFYECRKCYASFNPFISLIENSKDFSTIYSKKHLEWQNYKTVISYDKLSLWIVLVHQRNKSNSIKHNLMLTNNFKLSDFGIIEEWSKKSSRYILSVNSKIIVVKIKKRFTTLCKNALKRVLHYPLASI
jgi:hypothetical protein